MGARWRIAMLAGLFALVTACGGGGGQPDGVASLSEGNTPSSSDRADPDEPDDPEEAADQMRAYAKCMREHGVDMPDPEFSGQGGGVRFRMGGPGNGPDPNGATFRKAEEACGDILEDARPGGGRFGRSTGGESE